MPFLARPGVELYYEIAGNGAPLLFIQGVGVIGAGWRPQVSELQPSFETVLFDNRGIGRSVPCDGVLSIEAMASDALALMDGIGWKSAHVVGHSMGGVIAQELALAAPTRVRSLSLFCTFPRGKDAARLTWPVLWLTLRTRLGSRPMRRRAFLQMLFSKECLMASDLDELSQQVAQLVGRDLADQPPILMAQLRALARHDCLARLPELKGIPTLVVSAQMDPIALPRHGQLLARSIPGARYLELEHAGHGVTIERPSEISALIRQTVSLGE